MNITALNARESLDDFVKHLNECEFYAVDQEMTGVPEPGRMHQTFSEVYSTCRSAVMRYRAFQLGICLFTRVSMTTGQPLRSTGSFGSGYTYESRPYNFILRDSAGNVTLNMSSVHFLNQHNTDWQEWLVHGMPNCTDEQLQKHQQEMQETYDKLTSVRQRLVDELVEEIVSWLTDESSQGSESCTVDCMNPWPSLEFALRDRLSSSGIDGFPSGVPVVVEPLVSDHRIVVRRANANELERSTREFESRQKQILASVSGFHPFFKALVQSGKPHVGHNYAVDFMFLLHQHHKPLPVTLPEMCAEGNALFLNVFDTKALLANVNPPLCSTSLEPAYLELVERTNQKKLKLNVRHPTNFVPSDSAGFAAHNAAFDAHMTGCVLLHLVHQQSAEYVTSKKNWIVSFGCHFAFNLRRFEEKLWCCRGFVVDVDHQQVPVIRRELRARQRGVRLSVVRRNKEIASLVVLFKAFEEVNERALIAEVAGVNQKNVYELEEWRQRMQRESSLSPAKQK